MRKLRAFVQGVRDGWEGTACGLTFDDDPSSPCSVAYDRGRNIGDRLTR